MVDQESPKSETGKENVVDEDSPKTEQNKSVDLDDGKQDEKVCEEIA